MGICEDWLIMKVFKNVLEEMFFKLHVLKLTKNKEFISLYTEILSSIIFPFCDLKTQKRSYSQRW